MATKNRYVAARTGSKDHDLAVIKADLVINQKAAASKIAQLEKEKLMAERTIESLMAVPNINFDEVTTAQTQILKLQKQIELLNATVEEWLG